MADVKKTDSKKVKSRKIKENSVSNKKSVSKVDKVIRVKSRKLNKEALSKLEAETLKEINSRVNSKNSNKKIKNKKIRMSFSLKEEKEIDKQIENSDNLSVGIMIIILAICFILGISLGYILYRIAINSSNAMFIVKYLFS